MREKSLLTKVWPGLRNQKNEEQSDKNDKNKPQNKLQYATLNHIVLKKKTLFMKINFFTGISFFV